MNKFEATLARFEATQKELEIEAAKLNEKVRLYQDEVRSVFGITDGEKIDILRTLRAVVKCIEMTKEESSPQ